MQKKLIEFGWDVPSPTFLVKNIRAMEKRPFDGVMIKVGGGTAGLGASIVDAVTTAGMKFQTGDYSQVFRAREADERIFQSDLQALERIEWGTFTDNLVVMYATSDMDWFSEEAWGKDGWVLRNVRMCAKAAMAGRCKGVTFDAEPYWRQGAWKYTAQPRSREKSFAEYVEVVRRRGAQFISTLQEIFPNPVVHTLFLNSYFPQVVKEPDSAKHMGLLEGEFYGLMPAFLNGMLDAAAPGTIITDGNEESYYFTALRQFLQSYQFMRQTGMELVPENLRDKYRNQVQASQALYVDYLCGLRIDRLPGSYLTAEEQAKWVEHNVYWGLTCCDEYMWLYSENMNWWTGERVPQGLEEAVRAAKRKVEANEPLGFEIEEVTARATHAQNVAASAAITPRVAHIRRLGKDERPPSLSGRAEEPVWRQRTALEFVPFQTSAETALEAPTRAWVTWDAQHLYVAARCDEPNMRGLAIVGRDEEAIYNNGDRIELVLAPHQQREAYRRLAIDPWNGRWDGLAGQGDSSWKPDLRSAVHRGYDHWSVEFAMPWQALEMHAPRAGDMLAANLFRRRGRLREYSSWSKSRLNRAPEPENLGTWIMGE